MAERIPQSFIDDLISRTDIVELIDSSVHLKKAGNNYNACCPFHDEKTPSFTVSPDKQFYHCFGCGAHGTAISFLMEHERLGFIEAIETLASRAGIQIPRSHSQQVSAPSIDYDLLEQSSLFFQTQLREHSESQPAINYLKQRGLSGETAKHFGIGFAPPGWNNLLHSLGSNQKQKNSLVELGLVIKNDKDKLYDRFRNRVIFPIRDTRGRTIAFGGRIIDPSDTPKYLNSPESPAYHKSKELYGLWEAKQTHRKLEKLIIVEGYMDVVMLAQQGIDYAVATLGTAATAQHIDRLFRSTSEIIFCFDGDKAGRSAALRAMQHALPAIKEGHQARFMFLPEGEDPDTLVQKIGAEAFTALINQATPLSSFFFNHLQEQTDMSSLDGRARLIELARSFFDSMPDGVYKDMLIEELTNIAKIDINTLKSNLTASKKTATVAATHQRQKQPPQSLGAQSPTARAITLILHHPKLALKTPDTQWLQHTNIAGTDLLSALIEKVLERPNLTTAGILELWRDSRHGANLLKLARKQLLTPENGLQHELLGAIERIKQTHSEQRADLLLQKEHSSLTTEERAELTQALTHGKRANKDKI